MNVEKTISVIVPIYNAATYIEKCLRSLFDQSLNTMEYVFVDDCSTDNSLEILDNVISQYPNKQDVIKIVKHEFNRGVATARNSGLLVACGKYIGWVDADDWVHVEMFEKLYKKAESSKSDVVLCDFYNEFEGGSVYVDQNFETSSYSCLKGMLEGRLFGGMCNKLIARHLFDFNQIAFADGFDMCEDLRVNVQLFFYANKIAHLNEALYHYIKHNDNSISVSSSANQSLDLGWVENIKGIECFINENKIEGLAHVLLASKFFSKQNLLIKGRSITKFKEWRNVFPESNQYLLKSDLPIYYKLIAYCAIYRFWLPVRCYILVKYKLFKK